MKLYLVQHGEACAKEVNPERPLTEQGKEDVDRLGPFLKQAGIQVDRVIHSEKLRAIQTAERLANAIAPGVELETSGISNPNDNPKHFGDFVKSITQGNVSYMVIRFLFFLTQHPLL